MIENIHEGKNEITGEGLTAGINCLNTKDLAYVVEV